MSEINSARILVVEDETNVGSTLVSRLFNEGYKVEWQTSVALAKTKLCSQEKPFDLALLDVGLPDGTGFDLAPFIRNHAPQTSVIFLTAFGNPEDRVRGLELGAEDYVVKPFHFKELLLRIQNALKRAKMISLLDNDEPKGPAQIGKAKISFEKFEAEVDGKRYPLTHKECAVLKLLKKKKGAAVTRDEILDHAWSQGEFPTTRTVDNFIMRLRKIVENDPENPQTIRSIRGIGYQLHE